jgi:hypothetical protein
VIWKASKIGWRSVSSFSNAAEYIWDLSVTKNKNSKDWRQHIDGLYLEKLFVDIRYELLSPWFGMRNSILKIVQAC